MVLQENGCSWLDVQNFANQDNDEGWSKVDSLLADPRIYLDQECVTGAQNCLSSLEGPLQDLGATFFQSMPHDQFEAIAQELELKSRLLKQITEGKSPYAQFRAAFALYKHGDRSDLVTNKVIEAQSNDDVKDIATELLSETE
jgi:hypothetical protein